MIGSKQRRNKGWGKKGTKKREEIEREVRKIDLLKGQ